MQGEENWLEVSEEEGAHLLTTKKGKREERKKKGVEKHEDLQKESSEITSPVRQ